MPLNYNLKKKQIKNYILKQMIEKNVISSKLSKEELQNKIEDVELNKDNNIVLLTMENLELAKTMILLDGIILLGHTIRVSLYSEVKDLSMDNLQKQSAMANSANVTAKSAALSFAAFESIFRSNVGKKDIILNVNQENENAPKVSEVIHSNMVDLETFKMKEDNNQEMDTGKEQQDNKNDDNYDDFFDDFFDE